MKFSELVNVDELRKLCESYSAVTGAVTALLEIDGDILVATGWQDICTKFHRINAATASRCRESDTVLAGGLTKGERYVIYKCENGLIDVAVPIMIRGEHVANLFTGQFFVEPPDRDYFIRQAEKFGFDKDAYLEALQRVPLFSEATVKTMMDFFIRLAQLVGEMGLARKELVEGNQKLHKSEERLTLAIKAAAIGIFDWDIENNELTWDDSMYALYGIPTGDCGDAYSAWVNALHPEDRQCAEIKMKASLRGDSDYAHEFRIIRPDGATRNIKASSQTFLDADGKPLRMIGINIDITDRKKAEEERLVFEQQMQQIQKLESLGAMAGGIAHDFNNILAIIIGNCSLAEMNYETARNYIPVIEKAAERAAGLCSQMMAYAGLSPLNRSPVVMWLMVDDVVNMLKSTHSPNVTIKTHYSSDIPIISGDAGQLRQVVTNLIVNALEAVGNGQGEVSVMLTKLKITTEQSIKDHFGTVIPAGTYLCLEVADNGCGMDDETRRRIFEPFFTTKFTGRGLGMSAVLGIIKAHNGGMQLFSQPRLGTVVTVYLPAEEGGAAKEKSFQRSPVASWQGRGTLLLVEDEVQVLSVASAMLQELGFTVIEAANGKEALEQYSKNAADVTLVMTDIEMPVMDGYEFFREMKNIAPKLPIIISSGFSDVEVTSKIPVDLIAGLLRKPYNVGRLRTLLKSVVESADHIT